MRAPRDAEGRHARLVVVAVAAIVLASFAGADWGAGVAAFRRGEWSAALQEFQAVAKGNPRYAGAHYMIGQCQEKLGLAGEAAKAYREANRLEPENAQYALAHARLLLAASQAASAKKVLQAVRMDPLKANQKAAVLTARSQVELALGATDGAAELARQAVRLDPESADALAALGMALLRAGRDREAFGSYRRAWELGGDSAVGRSTVAAGTRAARSASGDEKRLLWAEVAAVATKLAETSGDPESALLAGESLLGAGNFEGALAWFARTRRDDALVTYYRGQCHLGRNRLVEAEEAFRKALAWGAEARLKRLINASLGLVLDLQKRYPDAAAAYAEAGEPAKAAAMRDKQALVEQNERADEEARRVEQLDRLQQEYRRLTQQGSAPSPTPTPHKR